MPTIIRYPIIAVLVASCAGCGGVTGAPVGAGATTGAAIPLGSRGVPGGTVAVSSAGAVTPGATNTFHLALSNGLVPATVTAWVGTDFLPGDAGSQALPAPTGAGTYDVSLAVPASPAAGSHVRVRLAFADGSVIETGADDFPFAGH